MSLRLAIQQTAGVPEAVESNLAALRTTASRAAGRGADLLVLPELWLTGYNIGERVHELAQVRDGPAAAAVADIARDAGIAIAYGYPERANGNVYIAAQLIDAGGTPLAGFRKAHLFGPTEKRLFTPGDLPLTVVPLGDVRLGLLICYDVEFPEAVRTLCLHGADLIVVPTALMHPYALAATHLIPTRAYENQAFVAYANRCGREGELRYVGASCICGPDGADLARAGRDEAMILADIDPARRRDDAATYWFLDDRRLDLYA